MADNISFAASQFRLFGNLVQAYTSPIFTSDLVFPMFSDLDISQKVNTKEDTSKLCKENERVDKKEMSPMNHTKTNSRHLCTLKKEILYQKTSGKVYVRRPISLI